MANEKNISLDNLKTFKKKADATYAKKTDITTSGLYVGKASEKSNSATTNGNTYLKLFDNDTKRSQHLINGSGATIVTSDASGTIKIDTPIKNLDTTSGSGLGNGRTENIVGKYSNYNTIIAEGSLFYTDLVVSKENLPDSAFQDVPEGYTVINYPVDIESTYANSMAPGSYINIYYKSLNDKGEVMFGKFISNIKILDVEYDPSFKYSSALIIACSQLLPGLNP